MPFRRLGIFAIANLAFKLCTLRSFIFTSKHHGRGTVSYTHLTLPTIYTV